MLWYFLEWSIPDQNGRNSKLTSLDYKKEWLKNHTSTSIYSWTSLKRPPWGQKKIATVETRVNVWTVPPPPPPKDSRCREVAFSGRSTVDFIGLLAQGHFINARVFSSQLFLMVPTEQIQTPSFLAWWIPVVYSLQRCLLFPERRVLLFIATVAAGLDLEVETILAFLTRLILIIAQLTWITHISCLLDRMPTPS